MELYELKNVFDAGGLTSVTVARAVLSGEYILIFKNKNNQSICMSSQRSETPRTFKTIDAAARNAEKVGFKEITVNLA